MNNNTTRAESVAAADAFFETDPESVIRTEFDTDESDAVVVTVVTTVATIVDEAVDAMPPLFNSIDTEAMTELMAHGRHRPHPTLVSFSYHGCYVTVSSRGEIIVVAPPE
ncbi:HalOD1 output domain-containing protein [Natronolimnobius baerhuensis]|uniref:Halobacterial output domain-containing protein n=1 Tax=Natronolimnobius baerhuensis TaxID=253108 RepID=A0A202E7S4_9EURY|nr:HalOD1 output domain-containing protein [Natronolimnobius baerhuensis]OVE84188.1 hypothetical protein B2G88_07130 [Natronolimnobius baerhuensis]